MLFVFLYALLENYFQVGCMLSSVHFATILRIVRLKLFALEVI